MWKRMNEMMTRISHRACYAALALCHVYAAGATGKWSVYLPMAWFYAVLAWRG